MTPEKFREIHPGLKIRTIYGGVGFINKKMRQQVEILTWDVITQKDYGHCSVYDINELEEIVE